MKSSERFVLCSFAPAPAPAPAGQLQATASFQVVATATTVSPESRRSRRCPESIKLEYFALALVLMIEQVY